MAPDMLLKGRKGAQKGYLSVKDNWRVMMWDCMRWGFVMWDSIHDLDFLYVGFHVNLCLLFSWSWVPWSEVLLCGGFMKTYFYDLEFLHLGFHRLYWKNLRFQYVVVSWNRISWPGVLFTWDFIRSGFMIWSFDQLRFHEIGLISWSRVLCNRAFMESDFMIWCCF